MVDARAAAPDRGDATDWTLAWQPLVDRVGATLDGDDVRFGLDAVELGAIRRWLEPLEFDCALHRDAAVARAHGWRGVIAPYTSLWAFIMPIVWQPGDPPTYADAERDTQPWHGSLSDEDFPGAPPTTAMFGTGISMEFIRPLHLGERVGAGPRRLVTCVPKQTRVGRGAFITFDRHVVTGDLEPVCRVESEVYLYNPITAADGA